MKDTDLAYIAGFLDGDGSIGYHHAYKSYYIIKVGFYNNDPAPIIFISKRFPGGSLNIRKARTKNSKDQYTLFYSGRKAIELVKQVCPYLVSKIAQAEIALEIANRKTELTEEDRKDYHQQLKVVNLVHRGG